MENTDTHNEDSKQQPITLMTGDNTQPTTTEDDSQQTRPTYPSLTSHASEIRREIIQVHKDLESFANDTLQVDQDNSSGITLKVCGHLQKGSGLSKFTVYLLKGQDRNGPIEVYRRFNQFYSLRQAMKQRWPGCFIPAVPDKNALGKNDEQIILNRQRFLNDFVRKIAKLPYLYYGEEFQTLVRSKEVDISVLFTKWPKPSYDDIILKYRDSFSELAGKEINKETSNKIMSFANFLKTSQAKLPAYKQMARSLAIARSQYDIRLANLFNRILPDYQKTCLSEYVNGQQSHLIYANPNNAKTQQHGNITKLITKKNPYWLIYDLIKLEQRDGQAFLQSIQSRETLELRKQQTQVKILANQRQIEEISMGKTTFKSMTTRGSKDEIKYRLELENKDLTKDRDNLIVLTDIVSALQAYITIDQYRLAKKMFYCNTLRKITGYEVNFVQNMVDIWTNCEEISGMLVREGEKGEEGRNQDVKE